MAKGLIWTGKNGNIFWELERGENRKWAPMVKAGMGQAVSHWRTLTNRTFASAGCNLAMKVR